MKGAQVRKELLGFLSDGSDLSELLGAELIQYGPLVLDGLAFFLEQLPQERLLALWREQASMAAGSSSAQRLVALLHHLPTLHKLGQVLARDRRLTRTFRLHLQRLESLEPRTPIAEVNTLLRRELPAFDQLSLTLGLDVLAEGSVAVVVPFRRQGCRGGESGQGVFKVLKPGIEELLRAELAVWESLGEFLDRECHRFGLPNLDYQETFQSVRDLLVHEVHLNEEQHNMTIAARQYADHPNVWIPKLLPYCTPRVTAMERIEGCKVTDCGGEEIAANIAAALVAQPLLAGEGAALFHGDPHAGNLFHASDGRLAILDWSLVYRLKKSHRVETGQMMLGALTLDEERIMGSICRLARKQPDEELLGGVVRESLRDLRHGSRVGVTWLTELLDRAVTQGSVRFDSNLLLFRKSLLTLEGVMADLLSGSDTAGGALLDRVLTQRFGQQLAREWPQRCVSHLHERAFGTGLSTVDLADLAISAPLVDR